MHKPWHTLIFSIVFFSALAAISLVFPEKGVLISNDLNLGFPSLTSLFERDEPVKDISDILEMAAEADSTDPLVEPVLPPEKKRDSVRLNMSIQYRDKNALTDFFSALARQK